jgi:hypothetical protein
MGERDTFLMARLLFANPCARRAATGRFSFLPSEPLQFHRRLPGYQPTPLVDAVAMDVAEERLLSPINHAWMCTERSSRPPSAHTAQEHADHVVGEAEAGRDLLLILVEVLGRDEQVNAAVVGENGHSGTLGGGKRGPAGRPRTHRIPRHRRLATPRSMSPWTILTCRTKLPPGWTRVSVSISACSASVTAGRVSSSTTIRSRARRAISG